MRRNHDLPQGTIHRLVHDSNVLVGNPQGEPHRRELHVYTPPGWTERQTLPLLVDFPGFGGAGPIHTAWKQPAENVPERLDRLIGEGKMPPVVAAFPDCAMRIGGNQYINSAGTGRYEDYLITEIVPFVEERFRCGGTGRRGCFGKSSGGYGAIWHGLHHADFWAAVACNSGDMGFDALHIPELYLSLDVLQRYEWSLERFFHAFQAKEKHSRAELSTRMFLAMGAHYDPDPTGYRFMRLPADPYTAELIPERWANWLRYDPALVAKARGGELKQLKTLFLDCGDHDQFRIHFGMRRLHRILETAEVPHVYEEFDDDHTDVDYRMDRFLPVLAKALAA
jgi:enterochelin esterase-like enzyme